jgi:ubiquinone/menaquinone biosynthesis C-methylase UbiE
MEKEALHSEQYFGDQRDFWWNKDFIQLMAKRWKLHEVKTILDVGSGQGHWGMILYPLLDKNAKLVGIEPEPQWRKIAQEKANDFKLGQVVSYVEGTAEAIPFPDNHFDMVTCQTVLIHVADPVVALKEMKRVLKPNGLLVAVEPNNAVPEIILNNLILDCPVDEIASLIKFQIICERGKEALREGNNMRGDLLPYYFSKVDLNEINSYLSDMADYLIPPYRTPREHAVVKHYLESSEKEFYVWNKQDTYRYFIAGSGADSEFSMYWDLAMKRVQLTLKGFKEKSLYISGGAVFYLTSGRKKL